MTGFGTASSVGGLQLRISIRSVNGRYLETRFHIPRELSEFEADLKKRLSEKVKRGTVDIFIAVVKGIKAKRGIKVNAGLLNELRAQVTSAGKTAGFPKAQLDVRDFLQLPGIIEIEDSLQPSMDDKKLLFATFTKALKNLETERVREGKSIAVILQKQLTTLLDYVHDIRAMGLKLGKELEQKLHERITRSKENVDPVRLGQELIFYLDRADIKEEISRLEEHIKSCLALLKKGAEAGKRLDFFCQELLREVNTIGSKSVSAMMTSKVVDAKTLIESIREQVQNLE